MDDEELDNELDANSNEDEFEYPDANLLPESPENPNNDEENNDDEEDDEDIESDLAQLATIQGQAEQLKSQIKGVSKNNPDAKKRLVLLQALAPQTKKLVSSAKESPIQNEEIQALAQKAATRADTTLKLEIAKTKASLAAQGIAKLIINTMPWSLIVIAILALILIFVVVIIMISTSIGASASAPYENVDISPNKFDTSYGIMGDAFWGARYIYYDDEKAIEELESNYENLVINLITKIDEINGIDFSIELNYNERPQEITDMVTIIADQTDNSDEALETLNDHLLLVDHFGYTDSELSNIKSALYTYLNASTLLEIDTDIYKGDFESDYSTIFDNHYSNLNITAPLYYVQDVYLESDESMISGLPPRDYIAMIYMPKINVTLDETSFMFYLTGDQEVNMQFIHYTNGSENVLAQDNADASWWDEDHSLTQSTIVSNIDMTPFVSFDKSDLDMQNGASIYSIVLSDNSIDTAKLTNIFSVRQYTSEDNTTHDVISYLPTLDNDFYLIKFEANSPFQFAEYYTKYELD